jgi:hypothetical protein
MLRRSLLASALCAALAATTGPAFSQDGVQVHVPQGIRTGFIDAEPGPDGTQYVVVNDLVVGNPSPYQVASYRVADFSLVAGDKRYHPVVRPRYESIDLSTGGVLSPHEALRTTLAFQIPLGITRAALEFTPATWFDGYGRPVVYCCVP